MARWESLTDAGLSLEPAKASEIVRQVGARMPESCICTTSSLQG